MHVIWYFIMEGIVEQEKEPSALLLLECRAQTINSGLVLFFFPATRRTLAILAEHLQLLMIATIESRLYMFGGFFDWVGAFFPVDYTSL